MARPLKPRSRQYVVTLDVPRSDGWRSWSAAAGTFGERLAAQAAPPVLAAGIDTETRRGADYVRIRITMTIETADVAGAVTLAWEAFRAAAGDPGSWDLAVAAASVRPAGGLLDRAARRTTAPGLHRVPGLPQPAPRRVTLPGPAGRRRERAARLVPPDPAARLDCCQDTFWAASRE